MAQEPIRVEISYKTMLFAVGIIAAVWFLIQIKAVIILLFVSFILLSALHSPVDFLEKKKIPRVLAILIIYLLILSAFAGIFSLIVPPLVAQTRSLFDNLPAILESINKFISFYQIPAQDIVSRLASEFGFFGTNFFKITAGFLSSILGMITLAVFTFYLLLGWPKIVDLLTSFFSGKQAQRIDQLLNDAEAGIGAWVRGELFLMFVVGLLSYIGLFLLGIPYALSLAVVAGLLEIVPIIGPIISAIPAVLIGLLVSPILALAVAALFFVVQQLENHLIVPNVMRRVVGVNPLITILALMIGAKLGGILGAFLAIPLVVLLKIIGQDLLKPIGDDIPED